MTLRSPYPYFGTKRKIAPLIWERFGNVSNFVDPFFGSNAVLLARPDEHRWWDKIETVNDADGAVCNFWRAVKADPEAVAHYADWPVIESDLHARNIACINAYNSIVARLEGDPEWYDAKLAGWWVWGVSGTIGGAGVFGRPVGPWQSVDGLMTNTGMPGVGAWRQLPSLSVRGTGVHRVIDLAADARHDVQRTDALTAWMAALGDRMRHVRICCGDWTRVTGDSITTKNRGVSGPTAVLLDPPYDHELRDGTIYKHEMQCAADVRKWAVDRGSDPKMRIALCGYTDEHAMPDGWTVLRWKGERGYASKERDGGPNHHRETIWFSPHCLKPEITDLPLFADLEIA